MATYYVIAKIWDSEKSDAVYKIVGTFNDYFMASLFKKSFDNMFMANALIEEAKEPIRS